MSGIESMMTALLKAVGFNPVQFREGAEGFVNHVYARLAEFDARMLAQETLMQRILDAQTQLLRLYNEQVKPITPINFGDSPWDEGLVATLRSNPYRSNLLDPERCEPDGADTTHRATGTGDD
jgi:hypothetical protein